MQIDCSGVKTLETAIKLTFYITFGLRLQFKWSINAVLKDKVLCHIVKVNMQGTRGRNICKTRHDSLFICLSGILNMTFCRAIVEDASIKSFSLFGLPNLDRVTKQRLEIRTDIVHHYF